MQEQLTKTQAEFEARIEELTTELEKANRTIKVLLKYIKQEKVENDGILLKDLWAQVFHHIQELQKELLSSTQKTHIQMIEENLQYVTVVFLKDLQGYDSKLTPVEKSVVNYVKEGRHTKEIAKLMNLSTKTIDLMRHNIRKKLRLNGAPISLNYHFVSH